MNARERRELHAERLQAERRLSATGRYIGFDMSDPAARYEYLQNLGEQDRAERRAVRGRGVVARLR